MLELYLQSLLREKNSLPNVFNMKNKVQVLNKIKILNLIISMRLMFEINLLLDINIYVLKWSLRFWKHFYVPQVLKHP